MKTWIILPYDASPLAKLTLRKVAAQARDGDTSPYAGVLLATAGIDPTQLDLLIEEAQRVARADIPLEVRLLNAGDPIGDLHELIAALPYAVLAAPVGLRGATGRAAWYAEACRLGSLDHTVLLFFVTPEELRTFEEEESDGRHRVGGPLGRLLRTGARLRLGVRAPVARKTA
jgi:hypothetical protein